MDSFERFDEGKLPDKKHLWVFKNKLITKKDYLYAAKI